MDKKIAIVLVIIFIGICIFYFSEYFDKKICFGEKCVEVEIADTSAERNRGLMFVSSLNEDEGMLFVFDENWEHSFWMKNTLIPLDLIWISEDFEIVHVETAEPCKEDPCPVYTSDKEAKYVLEVNAGWTERNGAEVGMFFLENL